MDAEVTSALNGLTGLSTAFRLGGRHRVAKLGSTVREQLRVGLPAHAGPVVLAPLPAGIRKIIGL
jgi:hypothetical protein